ncbi:uncharacterized protein LOC106462122 [Limulus polyphemus]|uniref:Uncharacterized protein LOC106462122 n=1 Tax=Limulus polyphemus TaxID=6850 RepID=A0ABM1SMX5_LIMPO|nr:uncharacterized protein LOC106462122 [Limulus polyphemus]XP_022244981.1 uncharacterized protein LOC106462122 [Limulus polyphemus]
MAFPYLIRRLFRRKRFFGLIAGVGLIFLLYQFWLSIELSKRRNQVLKHQNIVSTKPYQKADAVIDVINGGILNGQKKYQQSNLHKKNSNLPQQSIEFQKKYSKDLNQAQHLEQMNHPFVLGVLSSQQKLYLPNQKGMFQCIQDKTQIPLDQVNDDFCDCLDGSDEPGTSACVNSRFYCTFQPMHHEGSLVIVSSRVNDGICDCCDGSDEWLGKQPPFHVQISELNQHRLGVYQVPCQNHCSNR